MSEYNSPSSLDSEIESSEQLSSIDSDENPISLNVMEHQLISRKQPDDLKILNKKQRQYNAKNIYEWNLDDLSKLEIIQMTKEIVIVGNIYKQKVNITERDAIENIVLGFTEELRTWWDKLLSLQMKEKILNVVGTD